MKNRFRQLDNHELIDFLRAGGGLVDIRGEEEWRRTGVVEGSLLLTFFAADGSSDPEGWLTQLNALVSPDRPLALICRSGHRTGLVAEYLLELNHYAEVAHLRDGILGWLGENNPVVSILEKT